MPTVLWGEDVAEEQPWSAILRDSRRPDGAGSPIGQRRLVPLAVRQFAASLSPHTGGGRWRTPVHALKPTASAAVRLRVQRGRAAGWLRSLLATSRES